MTQDLGNSRILVIASEAKQSLGILDLSLGILDLVLEILNSLSSSGLTRGSLYGILEFPASLRGSKATEVRNSRFILGILDLVLGILEFFFSSLLG